jgi:hypothetical protein
MADLVNVKIVNKKEVDELLKRGLPNSVRFAVANTCSRVVFSGLKDSEGIIRDDFILRGGFVVGKSPGKGAVKYEKAIPHHDISKISATWGSVDKAGNKDYSFMEGQEEGFTNEKKPVPNPQNARAASSEKRKVLRRAYLKNADIRHPRSLFTGLVGSSRQMLMIGLSRAYREGFGAFGSNQFFGFGDNEIPGWEGGLFQFGQSEILADGMKRPNLVRLYYNPEGKSGNKKRRARHWMQRSAAKITQTEIDTFYKEEFNKQLARNIKKFSPI